MSSVLGRQRKVDLYELESSLVSKGCSRTARAVNTKKSSVEKTKIKF